MDAEGTTAEFDPIARKGIWPRYGVLRFSPNVRTRCIFDGRAPSTDSMLRQCSALSRLPFDASFLGGLDSPSAPPWARGAEGRKSSDIGVKRVTAIGLETEHGGSGGGQASA